MMRRTAPLAAAALLFLASFAPPRAHAVSKDMVQLQTQVQQLQDAIAHLQQSNDERMGVLQHLVEGNADSVNRMMQTLTALQNQVEQSAKNDTLAGQVQALNDSVDELRTRAGAITKQLTDIQSELQSVQQSQQTQQLSPPATTAPTQSMPAGNGPGAAYNPKPLPGQAAPLDPASSSPAATTAQAPSGDAPLGPGQIINYRGTKTAAAPANPAAAQALYQSALRDYNGAKYDLAMSEFSDVAQNYPGDPSAANANYYLGEISFRRGQYPAAIRFYDAVLEQFPGNSRAAAAQLRKAQAELQTEQKDAAIRDLRSLVQRYPTSPEGAQARSQLNAMGVRIVATRTPPAH